MEKPECNLDDGAGGAGPTDPAPGADGLRAFGFDLPADDWMGRVGQALSGTHAAWHEGAEADDEAPGQHIGPYELLALIGVGGMGAVWRARRVDKRPDRVVALKLIRPGAYSRSAERRFLLEEQVLSRLTHPGIARLCDGGVTGSGRPYLVMEYVDGEPILTYAERGRLSLRQRLSLFLEVCAAVQYAHGALVLHRDIKPGNILVGADGRPKLLDFGIAKLIDDDAVSASVTATDARVLTPRYASPEQVRGERLTTASDLYSLGVVLYELLTGQSPYRVDTGTRTEIERAVLEQEVRRPSAAVADGADPGAPDARRHRARLRGDLDTIVIKALQKDPLRRYASVEHFAADIDRHLRGLPITAVADSIPYRASRFVRRNKGLVAGLLVAAVALLTATAVSITFAVRESRARAEAEQRTRVAESINAFLNKDLLSSVDPKRTKNAELTMREGLDRAALSMEGRFADNPLVEASIRRTIGDTYRALGLPREAIPQLQKASALFDEAVGSGHEDARQARRDLVAGLLEGSRGEEALPIAEKLLLLDIEAAGDQSAEAMETRHLLGQLYPDVERKLEMFREILAWRRMHLGNEHQETLSIIQTLANEYVQHNRTDEAEPLVLEIWETAQRQYDESHPRYLKAMNLVSSLYGRLGRHEEALELIRENVRIHRETKPENFFGTGIMMGHMGQTLMHLKRFEEAETVLLEAHAVLSASLGPDAGWTTGVAQMLVNLYQQMGNDERADEWRQRLAKPSGEEESAKSAPD